jgi:hypothetical protein
LPVDYNDGRPVEESKFVSLIDELVDKFAGVTSTQRQFPLKGIWRTGGQVYQDQVVVFTSLDFQSKTDFELIRYLERLKARLKRKFEQLDVLITVQEMMAV